MKNIVSIIIEMVVALAIAMTVAAPVSAAEPARMSMEEYMAIGSVEEYEAVCAKYDAQPFFEEHAGKSIEFRDRDAYEARYNGEGYRNWYDFMPAEIQQKMQALMVRANHECRNRYALNAGKPLPYPEVGISRDGGFDGIDFGTWRELHAMRMPANAKGWLAEAAELEAIYIERGGCYDDHRFDDVELFGVENYLYFKKASDARQRRHKLERQENFDLLIEEALAYELVD